MANNQQRLIYALKDGIAVHISEVESGLKCGCVCPACGEPLVAKKGNVMMHHFAHHTGHNCEYGYETSLHLAAKEIISKAKKIIIPAVYLKFPESYKRVLLFPAKEISVDEVKLEQRYGDMIPDIVISSGGKELWIEIFVTHRIDEIKLQKLKRDNISTIEINLSQQERSITKEELSHILLSETELKVWVHNAITAKYLERFYAVADRRPITARGFTMHVDNCPLKLRVWKGKPYANFIDDCLSCEYCIASSEETGILCSGRLRIATLQDFNIPEEQRIKDSDNRIEDLKDNAFAAGNCPNCGCALVNRQGRYGTFIGCSNYPHCRFMAVTDPETGEMKMKS